MNTILLVLVAQLATAATGAGPVSTPKEAKPFWPVVNPLSRSIHFVDHQNIGAKVAITGTGGKPLYLLQCYLNAYDHGDDPGFNYSGNFECRLTCLYSEQSYSTLLTDEIQQTADWESRGRFLFEELAGDCAKYPEYGMVRHFRLRGMRLTLAIKNFNVEPGSLGENRPWKVDRIQSLDLKVAVASDPGALLEIAEPPPYLAPPQAHPGNRNDPSLNCSVVLRRNPREPYQK